MENKVIYGTTEISPALNRWKKGVNRLSSLKVKELTIDNRQAKKG